MYASAAEGLKKKWQYRTWTGEDIRTRAGHRTSQNRTGIFKTEEIKLYRKNMQ